MPTWTLTLARRSPARIRQPRPLVGLTPTRREANAADPQSRHCEPVLEHAFRRNECSLEVRLMQCRRPGGERAQRAQWVGWPGASQPPAPSDRSVTVSRHRALLTSRSVRAGPLPVGEQAGLARGEPCPPSSESFVGSQPLVLPSSPARQVGVDALQEGSHHERAIPPVIVHPPSDDGV